MCLTFKLTFDLILETLVIYITNFFVRSVTSLVVGFLMYFKEYSSKVKKETIIGLCKFLFLFKIVTSSQSDEL